MGSQIAGNTIGNILEVEAATKAARTVLYPDDYTTNGNYSLGSSNGTTQMAAGIAANSPIFSLRWTHATKVALIRRVTLSMGAGATAFAAGAAQFNLFAARSWSASDTGGTSILPTGNISKLKTGMATTQFGDARISATATLTAGTRTKDANPLACLVMGVPAVAGQQILAPYPMIDFRPGEYPLQLAQNEGIVIECVVPATGTWFFGVQVQWGERDSYF